MAKMKKIEKHIQRLYAKLLIIQLLRQYLK